jgi:hypothetical protein
MLDTLSNARGIANIAEIDALAKQQNHAAIAEHSGIKA